MTHPAPFVSLAGDRFARALQIVPLPVEAVTALSAPQSLFQFSIPVRMSDGSRRVFQGYRLRYNDAAGPTKGGVRFHSALTVDELTQLSFRILLKCAVNDLPHGGAAGGVVVDAKTLTKAEREELSRGYVRALFSQIGPDRDILSPDLYTDATVMAWMSEEYNRLAGAIVPAAINGKPVGRGGIPGRETAVARGAWTVLSEVCAARGLDPTKLTYAIQGFGSAGAKLARLLRDVGACVVAVSDSRCAWVNPNGLDVDRLLNAKRQHGSLAEIAGAPPGERLAPEDVLEAEADVLIPAATADQITLVNAPRLRCRFVLEIANGPVASDADAALEGRGITVIPDLVANAGGITVSHFEWVQNRMGLAWDAAHVDTEMQSRMSRIARTMIELSASKKISLAVAAQCAALDRLRQALAI
jgi:glutamate dehydrogenase (NADP+)